MLRGAERLDRAQFRTYPALHNPGNIAFTPHEGQNLSEACLREQNVSLMQGLKNHRKRPPVLGDINRLESGC